MPPVDDVKGRLAALAAQIEADPRTLSAKHRTQGDDLAHKVGGDTALRWRVAVMQSLITAPPDSDAVREAYGELVDRYRDDAKALATIKPIGDEIRRRETDGSLPSTMVARAPRPRSKTKQ